MCRHMRRSTSLEELSRPLCRGSLERAQGRHGLVWLCRECRAGAVTVPVLRRVAPRAFVNDAWQTALRRGRRSRLVCPACAEPFVEVSVGRADPRMKACVRCFWVWLNPHALAAVLGAHRAKALPGRQHVR